MTALYKGDDPMLNLGRRIRRIQTAFPELANAPQILMTIAQSPSDDDVMLDQAATTIGVAKFQTRLDGLRQLGENEQRSEWKSYDPRAQAALRRLGYKPPKQKSWGSINLPDLPKLNLPGSRFDVDLPNLPTIGPTKGANLLSNIPAVVTAPVQVVTQGLRQIGGATMDSFQDATDIADRGYRTLSTKGLPEVQFKNGVRIGTPQQTADAAALKLDVANAALDRAVADGTLTPVRATRLRTNPKSVLDWFDDLDDPDVPNGWDTYRAYSGSWADAWGGTEHKGRQFTPKAELDARNMLDDDEGVILLAKRVAAGESVASILTGEDIMPSSPEYYARAAELYEMMDKPKFDEAVKRLSSDKLSFGTDSARMMGLDPTTGVGQKVAMGMDLAAMFVLDPTLGAGKAFSAVRVTRQALRGVDVLDELSTIRKVLDGTHVARTGVIGRIAEAEIQGRVASHRRALTGIVDAYRAGTPQAMEKLVREQPQVTRGLTYLTEVHNKLPGGFQTELDVFDAITEGAGLATLASGQLGRVAVTGGIELPRLTRAQQTAGRTSRAWKDAVDWATDLPPGTIDNLVHGRVVAAAKSTVGNLGRLAASGGLQPIRTNINLGDAVETRKAIRGLALIGVSSQRRADLFTEFVLATNQSGRSEVHAAILHEMLNRTGIYDAAKGGKTREAAQGVLDRVARQLYSVNGTDEVIGKDGILRNVGVIPGKDFANQRQLPVFTELLRAGNQAAFMQRTYGFMTPALMEAFMSKVWKPMVLLRASFVPRAAGEEMLTYVLRHGGMDLAETFGSKTLAKSYLAGYAKGQMQAVPDMIAAATARGADATELARLAELGTQAAANYERFRYMTGTHSILRLTDKLAGAVPITRPLDRLAELVAGLATDVTRFGTGAVSNPEYVAAAKKMLAHEDYAYGPYADFVAGNRAAMNPYSEAVRVEASGNLVVLQLTNERSSFMAVPLRGDRAQETNWAKQIDRRTNSPVYRAAADAAARHIGDSSEAKLLGVGANPRFAGKDGAAVVRNMRSQIDELALRDGDLTTALERWATSGVAPTEAGDDFFTATRQAKVSGKAADREAQKATEKAAHAEATTWATVGRENLEFFLEPGVAFRHIEQRLLARAIQGNPQFNNAVVVGPNGKLRIDRSLLPKNLLKSVRDEAAEAAQAFKDLHVAMQSLDPRSLALVFSDANVQSGAGQFLRRDIKNNVVKAFGREDVAELLPAADRLAGVASPPKPGEMGMYFPVFEPQVVQALEAAIADPAALNSLLAGLGTHEQLILADFFRMLDPQMANLQADTLSRWATGSHVFAEEVGRSVYKAFDVKVPKNGVGLVLRDVKTPKGQAQQAYAHGEAFRGFIPADSEVTRLGSVTGVDVYAMPDHVVLTGRRLTGMGQTSATNVNGVLRHGVSREQAIEEWAEVVTDDWMNLFMSSPTGEVLHEVLTPMRDGRNVLYHVGQVPGNDLPKSIVAPIVTVSPDAKTRWERVVTFGFDKMIGPAISSLARQPLWIHNYAEGMKIGEQITAPLRAGIPSIRVAAAVADNAGVDPTELRSVWRNIPGRSTRSDPGDLAAMVNAEMGISLTPQEATALRDGLAAEDHVDRLVSAASVERALNQSIPYIDDHQVRSFFAEYAKGLVPFLYAQEQFIKRWMRTARHSPEALHRAQLYVGALRTIGFVRTDPDTGEDLFTLPLTGPMADIVSNTPMLSNLLGTSGSFPTPMHLTGSVKNLFPGVGDPFAMSPTPLLQAAVHTARNLFPELATDPHDDIYGAKPKRGLFEQFMPAWAVTMYKAHAEQGGSEELMRMTLSAAQVLAAEAGRKRAEATRAIENGQSDKAAKLNREANELEPPDGATSSEIEAWQKKVAATARTFMITRSIFQFTAPTAGRPTQNIALRDEFFDYLKTSETFDEAVGRFAADYPDDSLPFTVMGSSSASGARANYTETAEKWLNDNSQLAKDNPLAAPWLMPPGAPGDDSYSPRAFYDQVAYKWRDRKELIGWYEDLQTAKAAPTYNATKEDFEAKMAALPERDPRRVQLRDLWARWSDAYEKQHPTFWKQRTSGDARDRRERVRRQIMEVTEAGKLPSGPFAENVAKLVERYNDTLELLAVVGVSKTKLNTAKKKKLKERYISWADSVMVEQPELRSFYDSVIAPDADWITEED